MITQQKGYIRRAFMFLLVLCLITMFILSLTFLFNSTDTSTTIPSYHSTTKVKSINSPKSSRAGSQHDKTVSRNVQQLLHHCSHAVFAYNDLVMYNNYQNEIQKILVKFQNNVELCFAYYLQNRRFIKFCCKCAKVKASLA